MSLDKINKNVLSSSETTFADLQMAGGQSLIAVVKLLRKFGFDDDNIRKRVFGFSENGLYLSIVKEELKDYYKQVLNNGEMSLKGGGGLGMIDIARKTGQKLHYNFQNIDNKVSFFSLNIKITPN